MWIMLNKSFLSVVADRDDKDNLLVRARLAGHIESVFPEAKIFSRVGSDYLYRAILPRSEVAAVIANNIENINYDNFKNSVKNKVLHDAFIDIWGIMYRLQERFDPTKKRSKFKQDDYDFSDSTL